MIKNYYKQTSSIKQKSQKTHSCDFHSQTHIRKTTPPRIKKQKSIKKNNTNLLYILPKGEQKYYNECFPEEYTIYSVNNDIINIIDHNSKIIKCNKKKNKQLNTSYESLSEEDQTQISGISLQVSFNNFRQFQFQQSSRYNISSNRERIFEEKKISLSPLQRSLYKRNSSTLQSSKRRIFD